MAAHDHQFAPNREALIQECGLNRVLAAIAYTKKQPRLFNPAGFTIRAAQRRIHGLDLSDIERDITYRDQPWRHYTTGKYTDCIEH